MAHPAISTVEDMDLTGEPWLDFVNTGSRLAERYADPAAAESLGYGPFGDRLERYEDLVTWAERARIVSGDVARELRAAAASHPERAAGVLTEALALREALFRLFLAEAGGARGVPEDLEVLQRAAQAAWARRELVAAGDGYALEWRGTDLERVLWPVAAAALDALLSQDRARVKPCLGEDCNWLFRDASRNRSRRWCEMSACGNRAKARRYYRRHG